jgi:ABC-type multidrug transport system fused ATPase/permease subunit
LNFSLVSLVVAYFVYVSAAAQKKGSFIQKAGKLLALVLVLAAIAALGLYYWWVAVVIIIASTPELIARFYLGGNIFKMWRRNTRDFRLYGELSGYFSTASRIAEMRIFQNISYLADRACDIVQRITRQQILEERKSFRYSAGAGLLGDIARVFVVLFFVVESILGHVNPGTLVFLVTTVVSLRSSARSVFGSIGQQYEDLLFVGDTLKFLDLEPIVSTIGGSFVLPDYRTPAIEFRNVSFSYPGRATPALSGVSFSVLPGQRLAIVGVNGAGKTTLTRLLCGFYHPSDGSVLIDNVDLRTISLASWYRLLAVLFQDFSKFRLPVDEMVGLGDVTRTQSDADVVSALRMASADFVADTYPEGIHQWLGSDFSGIEPSGGQWQRLALARLFFRMQSRARVLILDEPTSALDAQAEEDIFTTLENLPRDKTVILISHRFSTVRRADRIIVLDNGTILEQGSHDELMALGGTYARLFSLQVDRYTVA